MKLRLRWALLFSLLAMLWGGQMLTAMSSHISSSRVLTRHATDIMENIAAFTMKRSQSFLSIAHAAAGLTKRMVDSGVVAGGNKAMLERYFFNQLAIYPQFAGIYFGGVNGQFFYVSRYTADGASFRTKSIETSPESGQLVTHLTFYNQNMEFLRQTEDVEDAYDPRERPWFIKAMHQKGLIWTDPYMFFTAKKPGITTAAPVTGEDGKIRGVVGIDIEIDDLSTFLASLSIGKNGKAFILHPNGDVLAHYDQDMVMHGGEDGSDLRLPAIDEIKDPLAQMAYRAADLDHDKEGNLSLEESRFTTFEHEGETYLGMFHPFEDEMWPWIIGIYMPEDDYLGALKENRNNNFLIAVFVTIVATIAALLLSRAISRPILNLEREAVAIREQDLDTTFATGSIFREIQETADSFARMKAELKRLQGDLTRSHLETIIRLAAVAEFKDHDTADHLRRVSAIAEILAEELGLPAREVELIKNGSPMHDVGKMGIPDAILLKPGPLTPDERTIIERHPEYGADILSPPVSELMHISRDIALYHHEKWDGSGYPQGLAGEEIPLAARIVALVDVFDAVSSERCYKPAMPFDEAVGIIKKGRGNHFDPDCVDAFMLRLKDIKNLYGKEQPS